MDNIDYPDNIESNLANYFIDDDIIINDDDETIIKFKKFLLKYKKIISIICLIILLIIGYYCNPYNIHFNNNHNNISQNQNQNQNQNGGSVPTAPEAAPAPDAPAAAAAPKKGFLSRTASKIGSSVKSGAAKIKDRSAARGEIKAAKHKQAAKDFGKKAMTASTYTDPLKNAGRAFGDAVSGKADLIFQIFYSIALFILICIVTIPAIAFVIVGLICFVLLKPKMAALKAL